MYRLSAHARARQAPFADRLAAPGAARGRFATRRAPMAPRRSLPAPPVGPPSPPSGRGGGGGGGAGGGGPRSGVGWPVAVAGVVVVLALLGAVLMVRNTGSDTGGDPAPPPETTTTTAKPATEEEVRAAVDEISQFVEDERGLEFQEPVKVELAGDDEFEDRLLEDFDEDADELEATGVVLAALGLVDPDTDIVAAMRELLGGGVVGFYDSETAELVVRGTAITPYVRTVMAHELTHALDDQHFELDRPALDDAKDESGFGFQSLVEGNARRVEDAYLASLSEDDQQAAFTEQFQMAGDIDITAIPQVLVEQITAPYELGEGFVAAVLDDGGQARLDAAFEEPPTTSEQVVEPGTFLAGEGAVEVAAAVGRRRGHRGRCPRPAPHHRGARGRARPGGGGQGRRRVGRRLGRGLARRRSPLPHGPHRGRHARRHRPPGRRLLPVGRRPRRRHRHPRRRRRPLHRRGLRRLTSARPSRVDGIAAPGGRCVHGASGWRGAWPPGVGGARGLPCLRPSAGRRRRTEWRRGRAAR